MYLALRTPFLFYPARLLVCLSESAQPCAAQGYKGNEILLVGGETGLWSWDVTKWESGDMGAGHCRSADAKASWVSSTEKSLCPSDGNRMAPQVHN